MIEYNTDGLKKKAEDIAREYREKIKEQKQQ